MKRILHAGLAIGILAMALAFPAPSAFADSPDDELDSLTAVRMLTDMLAAHDFAPVSDLFDEDLVFVESPQAIGGKEKALAWLDATDYDDIYYEEPAADLGGVTTPTPAELRKWLPGDQVFDGNVYVPDSLKPGDYKVRIGVLDARTGKPAVKLAIVGLQPDGWYEVGSIRIEERPGNGGL